jgi:hypothetical protein
VANNLLADIRARRVDIVVVYKVDRLTRSLTDFAKIVEVFDAQGISFYNERSRLLFTVIAEPSVSCAPLCCCRAASACFGEQRPLVGGVLFGSSVRSLRAANSGRGIHAILRPHFSRPVCRLRQRTMNVPAAQLSHARAPSEPTLQVF